MKNIQFLRLSHFIDNTSSAFAWLPRLATTVVDTFSVHTQSDHLTIQNIYFFQHVLDFKMGWVEPGRPRSPGLACTWPYHHAVHCLPSSKSAYMYTHILRLLSSKCMNSIHRYYKLLGYIYS